MSNLINSVDSKEERERLSSDSLLPLNGHIGCVNIIAAILGESPYVNI